MTIGENIKRIRKEKGLTQKELGEKLNMTQSAIGQFESDKTSPKIETIDKIAAALGVPIIQIMEKIKWEDYKNTEEVKRMDKYVDAIKGIEAILADMYGNIESIDLEGKMASGHYYSVGEGNNKFILYGDDLKLLYDFIKNSIPFLVDQIKDITPEDLLVKKYLKQLDEFEIPDEFK